MSAALPPLTPNQEAALAFLASGGRHDHKQVAVGAGLTVAQAKGVCKGLVKRGMVKVGVKAAPRRNVYRAVDEE